MALYLRDRRELPWERRSSKYQDDAADEAMESRRIEWSGWWVWWGRTAARSRGRD